MVFNNRINAMEFQSICETVVAERISLFTNYGTWEDRIFMKGPHLKVSLKEREAEVMRIRLSDERGLAVEIPCEGIEIIEVRQTRWPFEAHIYFFTFGGFARLAIIGRWMPARIEGLVVEGIFSSKYSGGGSS